MESNLYVTCFVDDDRHLVKVGEKGLETLLLYSKLHCDEKLEKAFTESSQVFVYATHSRDYANDQRIACNGVAPPNKNLYIYK